MATAPAIDELKPLERRIYDEIHNADGKWLSRADVSKLLGRNRVYPTDVAVLEKLTLLGLIDAREASRGGVGTRWEYRIKTNE
jgi:hypothetical protein